MSVMKMPVKELMENEAARTEACGWVLFGCGIVMIVLTLAGGGLGVVKAIGAGIVPMLFGSWLLDRARLLRRIEELKAAVKK